MKEYTEITFFQNKQRRRDLYSYRTRIRNYFDEVAYSEYDNKLYDTAESIKIRQNLNKEIHKIRKYLIATNLKLTVECTLGNSQYEVDVFNNMFNLYQFELDDQVLVDLIDQSIGLYEEDLIRSILRTINPLYWIGELLAWISSLPFFILKKAGFSTDKFEKSLYGRLTKLSIEGITLFTTLWTALIFIGLIPSDWTLLKLLKRH